MRHFDTHPARMPANTRLYGRRVLLRPLVSPDFEAWSEVRHRNHDWLTVWEPQRLAHLPDPTYDRDAFVSRCSQRDRERQNGVAYAYGLFVEGDFAGEVNLNMVHRGALMSATVGYWIDELHAGCSYIPEGVVVLMRHSFEDLGLHRLEICIVPRNHNSRRVMDKLAIRDEGVSLRFLEINGVWEDHVRYAITAEEWEQRRDALARQWL
ncbi:MAG: hypothetical protein RLZ37_286 [Actinomycetota bacterium]|jgi:ribosomal-protein-alanine N-acetyltransferase